ncbi:MAG: YCF48-related protein [Gammaproteobacteria bacterium]|nr:YCF48-related protein [Gammaproteobacteria bacterium]MCW9058436.1 YCF48-related protein [Gammaproteobacteria bacterium]
MNQFLGLAFVLYVALVAIFAFSPRQGSVPPPPEIRIEQLLMLDGLVLDEGLVVVGERGRVFFSEDGMEWRSVATPTRATLTALAAVDGRHLVAVGHDEVILRSEDGGEHWRLVHQDPEADGPLLTVWFDADGHGLAAGAYGRILESRDGGASWQAADLESGDPHLNAIVRGPDGRLLIAGEAGTLLRSSADDEGWETLPSPYAGSYFGLLPTPDGALLAFGMRGHLYRSRDAGEHWQAIAIDSDHSLFGGRVPADGRVLLTGQNGLLLREENGQGFVELELPNRNTYTAVLPMVDRDGLVLVGEGGVTPVTAASLREAVP